MRPARHRSVGFTLIELIVVVAVIGTLCAIAIPIFSGRQGKAYEARVAQDARNAATAEEAYFGDLLSYFEGDCSLLPGVQLSPGVLCNATILSSDSFQIQTSHPLSPRSCTWTSNGEPNLDCS